MFYMRYFRAKQDLRLSRIEQECSRMRRPSRKTIESRSILRLVNSSPIPDTKDVFSVQVCIRSHLNHEFYRIDLIG